MALPANDMLGPVRPHLLIYIKIISRVSHAFWVMALGYTVPVYLISGTRINNETLLQVLPFVGFLAAVIFHGFDLYDSTMFNRLLRLRPLAKAWGFTFLVLIMARGIVPALGSFSRAQLAGWFFSVLAALFCQRLVMHKLLGRIVSARIGLQNLVILGRTENARALAAFIQKNADIRTRLVGHVDDRTERAKFMLPDLPDLGTTEDLRVLVRSGRVQQILIALPWTAEKRVTDLIRSFRQLPVNLLLAPDMAALQQARNRINHVAGLPMFNISDLPLRGWSPLIKRVEDILLALLILVLCLPLMLVAALLIRLDSPGPALFKQKRFGYNNHLIDVYKFRSMYVEMADADATRQTTREDPRVTRIGRFIRKTSIDELPQLFNVLGGTMSMVGPRPHAAATKAAGVLFEDAVEEYVSRYRVKPGITGWAQINGYRGETDTLEKIEKRVAYDLEYIENWSLWFDLSIMLRTPVAVLGARAAY